MNLVVDMVDPRYRNQMRLTTRLRIVCTQDNAFVVIFVVNRSHMPSIGPDDLHLLPNSRKRDTVGRTVSVRSLQP